MPLAPNNHTIAPSKHEPARSALAGRGAPADCDPRALPSNSLSASRHLHRGAYSLRSVHTTGGSLRHHHGPAWDLSRRLLWRSFFRRLYPLARLLIYTWP